MLSLAPKFSSLAGVDAIWLTKLVEASVPEDATLDYKAELYPANKMSREWCKDLCALANTEGGCLLFGITEENGTPAALLGIECDPDAVFARLEQIAQANVRPRVLVKYHRVEIAKGRYVLLAATPKSRFGPHMTVADDDWKFYKRSNSITTRMDVEDLRHAFLFSASAEELAAQSHLIHINQIAPLQPNSFRIILDVFPLPSGFERLDLTDSAMLRVVEQMPTFSRSSHNRRISFDGHVRFRADRHALEQRIL